MSLADVAHSILAGDLTLRVRPDTTGLDAELAAKLTAAERTAETSATRIGASSGRAVAAAEKVQVAQLRATAAEERYNAALTAEERNVARIAGAQASLITARQRATRATAEQNAVLAEQQRATRAAAEQNAVFAEQQQTRQRRSIGLGGTIGLVAATVGVEKLVQAYHEGVNAAERLQVVQRQTDTEISATGGAAGVSADQVGKLSEAVAHYSGVQDTVVAGAENVLLNFTAIGDAAPDRTFDRATKAAVDLAIAQHNVSGGSIDVASQAKTLGLALNDPANGLDRLRRAGIAFTAQQREQIKAMAEAGRVGDAQARILDLVERKVGGSAQAFGDTAEGQAAKAHVAYEELSRTLAVDLLPAVTKVETALTDMARFFGQHRTITDTALALGGVSAALLLVVKAEQAIKALRTSEVAGIGARLLGYRSLERAQVQLAAAEDRHAEAAGRVAVAETASSRATAAASVTTEESAAAQTAAAVESDAAAAGAGRGILSRLGIGAGAAEAGAIAAPEVAVPVIAAAAVAAGAAYAHHQKLLTWPDLLTGGSVAGIGIDWGIRSLLAHGDNAKAGTLADQLQARIDAGTVNRGRATDVIDELNQRQHAFLGIGGRVPAQALADAQRLLTSTLQQETYGRRDIIVSLQAEKNAIYNNNLARARAAQATADSAEKAYRQARAFQGQVRAGDPKAVQQVEQIIGAGPASLFDPITTTTGSAGSSSQYSIDSARASVASASQSVQLDEQKLEQLRRSDMTTSLQLASAETALSRARTSAQLANERLANAEGKSADTRKSTALSLSTVLDRAVKQVGSQQSITAAARKLVDDGITQPVLQQLYALDQKAPGTLVNVADHMTRAAAHKLDHDERLAHAARHGLEVAFSAANTKSAEKAAARSADLAAAAWQRAYLTAIRSPEFWQIVQTDLGRLLVGNLGVLPGDNAPGTGQHGRAPTLTQVQTQGLPGAANYNFNGPVTFTDPGAGKRAADAAAQRRRQHALSGGRGGGHLMERP